MLKNNGCVLLQRVTTTYASHGGVYGLTDLTTLKQHIMFTEKAGELAGKIWEALNEGGQLTGKELKKATKIRSDKDFFLALGWLLREDKVTVEEVEKDVTVVLK